MVNTEKLKRRMSELGITQAEMAARLGIAQSALNRKINNISGFDLAEANRISAVLNITSDEFEGYFFA